MDLKKIAVDVVKEDQGEWVDLGTINPDLKGINMHLRSANNEDYKRLNSKLQFRRANRIRNQNRAPDPIEGELILATLFADTVILDWNGIEEAGRTIDYSRDEAYRLMSAREYRRLQDAIVEAASLIGDAEATWLEDARKNSKRESPGS